MKKLQVLGTGNDGNEAIELYKNLTCFQEQLQHQYHFLHAPYLLHMNQIISFW